MSGRPETRKMLKLSNMHSGMNGVYKVTSKAKYCHFHKEIRVEVYGKEMFDDVFSACLICMVVEMLHFPISHFGIAQEAW